MGAMAQISFVAACRSSRTCTGGRGNGAGRVLHKLVQVSEVYCQACVFFRNRACAEAALFRRGT